jgi:hypothetical protein
MYLMVLAMGIWIGAVSHNAGEELFIKGLTLSLLQRRRPLDNAALFAP